MTGTARIALTGGAENMSQSPFAVRGVRFGTGLGAPIAFEDTLWVGLTDTYCKLPMALTAENLGEQYKIARADVDKFALRSQQLWKAGLQNDFYKFLFKFYFFLYLKKLFT